jgi:arsenate reductase
VTSSQTDASERLGGAVDALSREFAGMFARETVAEVLADSLERLRPARVRTYQPVLAYRFARQRLQDAAATTGASDRDQPVVLFVCGQNAGRSQMAAALLEEAAEGRVVVRSAGSEPTEALHDQVVDALAEAGVDTAGAFPKPIAPETLEAADVVVTMGCGDACPVLPGRRYLDWDLLDPATATPDEVRDLRDDLAGRVQLLLHELLDAPDTVKPDRLLDDALLRLLGDPLRARIVELLSAEALCTSHLVERTGARQTNLSNHLKLLREAGVVTTEPCGRFTYYVLAPEPLTRLGEQLAHLAPADPRLLPRRTCP